MPTSDPGLLTPAAKVICGLNPQSVLDVGIGIGKWGLLVREYTDVWNHQRFYRSEWQTTLVGVEIHSAYKNPVWDVYTEIYLGNAITELPRIFEKHPRFDLIVMIDVLEHFQKEDGLNLIKLFPEHASNVLISYANIDQSGIRDNPFEDHVSRWTPEDFPGGEVAHAAEGYDGALMLIRS
jgi:hypothetical protein